MALSNNVISQFVRVTSNKPTRQTETTHFGTVVEYDGGLYVQLDGSEVLTPVSTTSDMKPGDRVTVLLKNHNATVTGNVTDPSASSGTVKDLGDKVAYVEAEVGNFDTIYVKNADIDQIIADKIEAGVGDFDEIYATKAEVEQLIADEIIAERAEIDILISDKITANRIETDELYATKAEVESLENTYANIEFSNITEAAIDKIFAKTGLIEDLTISNGTVTGTLSAVEINADKITSGTLVADRLLVKGEDGLYYKLNTDGLDVTVDEGVDLTEGIHGGIILAESITADKISVTDLQAFGATIGGFKITTSSLYSGVKESIENTTDGIYMDDDGQFALGNSLEYLKYYKDAEDKRHLEIAASSVLLKSTGKTVEETIDDIEIGGTNLLRNSSNLIFIDYRFNVETVSATDDGNGNVTIVQRLAEASVDSEGNVTMNDIFKASDDGAGNVTLTI